MLNKKSVFQTVTFISDQCEERVLYRYSVQIICANELLFMVMRCVKSDVYYTTLMISFFSSSFELAPPLIRDQATGFFVSRLCPNETDYNYQKCISLDLILRPVLEIKLDNEDPCGAISCFTNGSQARGNKWQEIIHKDWICDLVQQGDILGSGISCKEDIKNICPTSSDLNEKVSCDLICDFIDCSDEKYCNGFHYGITCKKDNVSTYIPPRKICDQRNDCDFEEDEWWCEHGLYQVEVIADDPRKCFSPQDDSVFGFFGHDRNNKCITSLPVRIFNHTRCASLSQIQDPCSGKGVPSLKSTSYYPLCENFRDQTNCSDAALAVITCPVDGYNTTVSKAVICKSFSRFYWNSTFLICDDRFDLECRVLSPECEVHKHKMCDNEMDCEDKSDEEASECLEMSEKTCFRRYKHETSLPLPISWLNDGLIDCENGVDESENEDEFLSPTCKFGESFRFIPDGSFCENVFLCGPGSTEFVNLDDLCAVGSQKCPAAVRACKTSRPFRSVFDKAIELKNCSGITSKYISYCLPGVATSLGHHIAPCSYENFIFPKSGILGVAPTPVLIPKERQNCKNFFGEQYVILACLNRCFSTACPLKLISPGACKRSKFDVRSLSITRQLSNLSLVYRIRTLNFRDPMIIKNDLFQCKNDRCVTYEKMCNLVDDCGDQSDEKNCSSVFHCEISNEFIPTSEKCNGKVQCNDHLDECNDMCGKEIISGLGFKMICWIIGLAAVVLNVVRILQNTNFLFSDRLLSQKADAVLGLLINLGDLLTGLYLVSIVVVDTIVYGAEYCKQRYVWLSSDICSLLGVVSTVGTQISLFSMTLLSLSRLFEVLKVKIQTARFFSLRMLIVFVLVISSSLVIAVGPLLSSYEDLFVNGMTYSPDIRLFLPYVDKQAHLDILKGYLGRVRMRLSKWKDINSLVDHMFTHDYQNGTLDRRKIHFYGNDGVCLFKYFVNGNDPQKNFVWSCLGLNLFCFFVISLSYGIINVKYEESVELEENLTVEERQNKKEFQKNIAIIIITDYVCWVPFIFICLLHSLELIDATPTYPIFSLVVLPINSVINPLLYGDPIKKRVKRLQENLQKVFSNILGAPLVVAAVGVKEEIELDVFRNRNNPAQLGDVSTPEDANPTIDISPPDN